MRAAAASPPPLPPAAETQPRPLASLLPLAAAADDTTAASPGSAPAGAAAEAAELKKELCELLETLLDLHQQYAPSDGAGSKGEQQQVAAAEAALLPLLMAGYGASCSPTDAAVWSLAAAINQRQWQRELADGLQGGRLAEGNEAAVAAAAAASVAAEGDADMTALAALLHGPLSRSW
jgi:sirohydrochlorin ferrochelatase